MRPQREGHKRQPGFTLVELVIVIVLLAVVAVIAATRSLSSAETTLPAQAERLARDIRHAQMLAATWGKSLTLNVTSGVNGSYSVSCTVAGAAPCNISPVTDPATGRPFTVTLEKNVTLTITLGPASVTIDSLGRPSAAVTYTLSVGDVSKTVAVQAITGFVTVS